jgi:hypothetical protein
MKTVPRKKSARGKPLMRFVAVSFSLLLVNLFIPALESRDDSQNEGIDPPVSVDILSRHVRLLGERGLKEIVIIPDNNTIINDTFHNVRIQARAITVVNDVGIRLMADSQVLSQPVNVNITGMMQGAACTVRLQGEERRYPLPMNVSQDVSGLRFRITERLSRYAVDSARAEYGMAYWKDREAVMALAHIIAARYRYRRTSRAHNDADFCDLTHCQVYRGRSGGDVLDDEWMIDTAALAENLYFHSRCGGSTFDNSVFSSKGSARDTGVGGIRDYLFRDGTRLCQGPDSRWERSISSEEVFKLLSPDTMHSSDAPVSIMYDRRKLIIRVTAGDTTALYAPETFRLVINRVRGWNFIKSNNYTISEKSEGGKKMICFEGEGLGHGVGFCQHGAVALSRRGYNRFEILEHYYPGIIFRPSRAGVSTTPYLSYCMFDLASGSVLSAGPGPDVLRRNVPPGSIFKLIVSLYLAAERPDIFNDYTFICSGKNERDAIMPDRCWNQHGHGSLQIRGALAYSCNLYFASLYNRISAKNFSAFFSRFCRCTGINATLPECAGEKEWSYMLAGLDFRLTFTIDDYIKLVRYLNCGEVSGQARNSCDAGVPYERRLVIYRALGEACARGTAGGVTRPYGASCNYNALPDDLKKGTGGLSDGAWGKTATVVDGTNRPVSYGIFIGGAGSKGIVAVLRKSNGHIAARWARLIMMKQGRE